ncbi:hypothetical protein B0H11DRAFT_1921446 [Mycena galericulata]|nr:hypothetical protein B0H11DRAFT_1921446 [Mycena galericulata]
MSRGQLPELRATTRSWTRFVLSPDKEWASKGAISGIEWEQDYRTYLKLLTTHAHLPHVKNILKTMHDFVFAGLKISSNDATASGVDDGTEDAIADAMRRFELGVPDDNDGAVNTVADDFNWGVAARPAPEPIATHPEVIAPALDIPREAEAGPPAGRRRGGQRRVASNTTATSSDVAPRSTRSRR